MKMYFEKVTGYLWHMVIVILLMGVGTAAEAGQPTQMVISTRPSNVIIMLRNYEGMQECRESRTFVLQLADVLKSRIWVTCTPMVFS